MIRFVVLYPAPTDAAAFDRHYFDVHVPLAKRLPGLRRYTVSRGPQAVRGDRSWHLVAELDWDDMASLESDLATPAGVETNADVDDNLARWCPGIESMIMEIEEV